MLAQRLKCLLPFLPDDVYLSIAGDGFEGDVGDAFVNEAMANVIVGRLDGRHRAGDFCLLDLALAAVGEQVERIACAHDAGTRKGEGNAGSVYGYPSAAPLFSDVRRGARAARGVHHKVAWVRRHKDAALYY